MRQFRLLLPLLCLLSSSGLVLAGDKYALLIGVSKYDHAEMNKPEPLKFPEADAKALGAVLKSGGYEVETVLGEDATRETIEKKLTELSDKGSADGVVLIGLFGHGVEVETSDDDKNRVMVGCFCPFNTKLRVAKDGKGRTVLDGNGQPMTEPDPASLVKLSDLMITLKLAKAGNRVVLADCCRTVPNQARGRSFGAGFRAQDLPDNTSVLFGCSPNEQAFEHKDWGHGAFTMCLLDQLQKLSTEGSVTTGTLIDRLRKDVPRLVATVSPRNRQTPKLFSTDSVDLQLLSINRGFEGTKAGDRKELSGMAFRWCPSGTFTMGSPKSELGFNDKRQDDEDQVEVTLSKGYWLGETELTQGQWQRLMGTTPWKGKDYIKEGDDYAASCVNHDDAVEYCKKLTSQERSSGMLPSGWKYSLPTESQWEYACRAGTTTKYSFGSNETDLSEYGWWGGFLGSGNAQSEQYAHRVGQKKANGWGLKDMHGNVWEWCGDWYGNKLPGGRDPDGPSSGSYRVNRGGGWFHDAVFCRSAYRYRNSPDYRYYDLGLRLAAVPE